MSLLGLLGLLCPLGLHVLRSNGVHCPGCGHVGVLVRRAPTCYWRKTLTSTNVSNFVKEYTALHAPQQVLPNEIIPDTTDDVAAVDENDLDGDERTTTKKVLCRVQIQAEDYGGGIRCRTMVFAVLQQAISTAI
ncbi:hypothetical protein GQ600_26009 [Phytophthora cactorum]|nr:hypothetical protein GQ600_26009 [Phytophthora cactorum]